jgi:hypothetical protein
MKVTENILFMTMNSTGHPKHLLMNTYIKLNTQDEEKKAVQN